MGQPELRIEPIQQRTKRRPITADVEHCQWADVKRLSDTECLEALYETPLSSLPLIHVESARSRGQHEFGFGDYPINEANAAMAPGVDEDRALEAVDRLHLGLLKVSAEHLVDRRVSDAERADRVRWFLEEDSEAPHWHATSFETCCRLWGADPGVVRQGIFRVARKFRAEDRAHAACDSGSHIIQFALQGARLAS